MPDTPTFEEVFTQALQAQTDQMRTILPAKIIRVNAKTVDVQPVVWPTDEAQPILSNVPILWIQGGGGYLVFRLAPNDFGALFCTEASMDEWRRTGESGVAIDVRKHHIASTFFIPGLTPATGDLTIPPLVPMGYAALVGSPELRLGSEAATESVLQGDMIDTAMGVWIAAHGVWVDAVVAGGPPLAAAAGVMKAADTALGAAITAAKSVNVKVGP